MHNLVASQTAYKLVLMAYDQDAMRELGRIVANAERRPFPAVLDAYREAFARALHEPPRYTALLNVLEHAWGTHTRDVDPHPEGVDLVRPRPYPCFD